MNGDNDQVVPRISLRSALLVMTIIGMAIVMARLWLELKPLREEVVKLRAEQAGLRIETLDKVHAIRVPSDELLKWKWRVWIPDRTNVRVRYKWGDIPTSGFPDKFADCGFSGPGEHLVTLSATRDPQTAEWWAYLETRHTDYTLDFDRLRRTIILREEGDTHIRMPIPDEHLWFNWPLREGTREGVGDATVSLADHEKTMVLERLLIKGWPTYEPSQLDKLTDVEQFDGQSSSVIIWLERLP
jgi:hypothetical protein